MAERSHSEIRSLLQGALRNELGAERYVWIRDIYSDSLIYSDESSSKMYRRDFAIDSENKVTLGSPKEVIERTSYELVTYATFSGATATNGMVIKEGKIFEAGDYPDKGIAFTPEDLQAAVAAFAPVDLDLEHIPTVLDGKLGQLQEVKTADDGKTLMGKVAIPEWLDKAVGNVPLKVSCTWDRASKKLAKLALVLQPRVSDAAIMSAFAEFAGKRHSAQDEQDLQSVHDAVVRLGAACKKAEFTNKESKEKKMSFKDKFFAWLDGVDAEATPAPPAQTPPAAVQPAPVAAAQVQNSAAAQPDPEVERLRRENAEFKAQAMHAQATSWADEMVRGGHAYPAERDNLIAVFTQLAQDDEANPREVTFSEGSEQKKGTRLDAYKASIAARPVHGLTVEGVRAGQTVLYSAANGTGNGADPAQVEKILAATPEGQAFLAERARQQANGNGTH